MSPKKGKTNKRSLFRKLGSQDTTFQPSIFHSSYSLVILVKTKNEAEEDLQKFHDSSILDSQFSVI